jgi:hypothetical protein
MFHKHLEYLNQYIKAIASLKDAESEFGQELQALASLELDTIRELRNSLAEHRAMFIDTKKLDESKAKYEQLLAQMDAVLKEFTDLPCQKLTLLLDARKRISPKRLAKLPEDAEFVGLVGVGISAVFHSKKNNSGMICSLQMEQKAMVNNGGTDG